VARVVVNVMLKPEILDPQGRAVQGALGRLGLTGVSDVRQGNSLSLTLRVTSMPIVLRNSKNSRVNS